MSNSTPPLTSPPPPLSPLTIPEMASTTIPDATLTAAASSLFEWSDLLDFNFDDPFASISFNGDGDQHQHHENPIVSSSESKPDEETSRIRKRDPRLLCSNFVAGRVPCACPELDEKLEQEEVIVLGGPGKKRPRTVRAQAGSKARCQVPGCEVDISELKGYHKRHRVCLRCANASAVVLDGQSKRYCQQCGKFHILSDFDEGKRSCRRKLEVHNNRRRRKGTDSKGVAEQEDQLATLSEDISCDDETAKDNNICLSSQITEKNAILESEQVSTLRSTHDPQNVQGDCVGSFAAFGKTQNDGANENPSYDHSPSDYDNKSAFSSMCPTGRISFKLYDWNPAEFPRRLRHQIFHWLASMPVELEGYIRPGCTILTVFIAMPKFMWIKLSEEPALYLHEFVSSPGNMLSGRGVFFAYLNDIIYRVRQEATGTSVLRVKLKEHAPKLHYVHPTCFEAGKRMEFVVCGSNLLQPQFRLLVSFAGNYLTYESCVSSSCNKTEEDASCLNHQLLKIFVPQTQLDLFGPAFVEVENESGLSNFIPVLIGDEEICAEIEVLQQRCDLSLRSQVPEFSATSSSCQVSTSKQTEFSQFIADVAWSLKKPVLEEPMQPLRSTQIKRINNLLNFLLKNESTVILDRILTHVKTLIDNSLGAEVADTDMELLHMKMDSARDVICRKSQGKGNPVTHSGSFVVEGGSFSKSNLNDLQSLVPPRNQGMEVSDKPMLDTRVSLTSPENSTTVPLLKGEVVMSVNLKERAGKSCSPVLTKMAFNSRPLIFAVTAAAVCFGVCTAILHPQKVGEFATTIRRCLLEKS